MPITATTSVEVVLDEHPAASSWLLERGVVCLRCGEPFWGSLGELLANKGYNAAQIEEIVGRLNQYLVEVES
ncbi:MAG: hypothetical protein GF399_12595 [Candidatus Coatesbacteria bacterium]|nr:hypothetical protein [Candidatus Coatesbacteria bacterium]